MKSLKLCVALVATLGLTSAVLADCGSCGNSDPCCGHGLLSRLKLHKSCGSCCEAPKPCKTECDPCGGSHLSGMLSCIKLPKINLHRCGGCNTCEAPKCCEPKPCAPKCCAPKPCAPKCCAPKPTCCAPKCDSCNSCCLLDRMKGMFHRGCGGCNTCETKPACGSCNTCNSCHFSLSKLLGKRCCPCDGATATEAAPSNSTPAPTPAPKPMGAAGANSNGLLILTPAG